MNDQEWEAIRPVIVRLRASLMAVTTGVLGGFGLFVSTIWLVQRGGPNVGQHLSLLSNYFPGYRVSWGGAFIGFGYGALTSAAFGYSIAWVYNYVLLKRLGNGTESDRAIPHRSLSSSATTRAFARPPGDAASLHRRTKQESETTEAV